MILEWDKIKARHDELGQLLADPSLDTQKRLKMQKEHARLSDLLEYHERISHIEQQLKLAREQRQETKDAELQDLFNQEISDLEANLKQARTDFDDYLFPPDPHDDRSVFVEIRAGAGGQEAALFAADLAKMYTGYALRKGWQVSTASESFTDLGGFREVVLHIQGNNVYGHLKRESGVHRVQRVPATETQGRVHTSTATVAVLPEAKEVDVQINPADLRIDVYRSGGAGGQHVNTTDSAVRITHIPTGAVVACQDERSQHKNKAKAMKMLSARILAAQVEKAEAEMAKQRKDQVGGGMRAEKIRTYNYAQNRVSDHQVEVTLKKLDMFMQGDMDEIIEPLMQQAREARKKYAVGTLAIE